MSATGHTKPEWANETIRLDPYALPQRVAYDREGRRARFMLEASGATMKHDLSCGLPVSIALPTRAYKGVAARAFDNEDGSTTVTLELLHSDPALSVPLCVSDMVEDAAADWHSWSKRLGLPMLMVDQAGVATVVKQHSALVSRTPKPRRRRVSSLRHRPNFLRRRKSGMVGPAVRITAREIIART